MYPNYNYFPSNQQQIRQQQLNPQMQIMYLKGRPVSSVEEVRAIPIDFDGSVFYFPDIANKRIYTKQINLDGTASIFMYEYKPQMQSENNNYPDMNSYITRDEFNNTMNQIKSLLYPKEESNNIQTSPSPQPVKKEDIKF